MAKTKAVAKYKTIIPRAIRQLFGPPPLLSTEIPTSTKGRLPDSLNLCGHEMPSSG